MHDGADDEHRADAGADLSADRQHGRLQREDPPEGPRHRADRGTDAERLERAHLGEA